LTASVRRVSAVAVRELRSAFVTPVAWIALSIAGLVAAFAFFAVDFADARPASLRTAILAAGWALLATAPALSMRVVSEELRLKTWETLFASPLSPFEIVLGKALACAILIAASTVPVALLALPLELYAAPDYGEIACGLLGLFLAGCAAASIGLAVSTTTASQTVAFLGAFFLWLGLIAGSRLLVGVLPIEWAPFAAAADPLRRLEGFALGLLDTAAVAYFAAIMAVGVAAATVSLERIRDQGSRRPAVRIFARAEAVAFVSACIALGAAAVALLSTSGLRVEADATKTRAYSLAPPTVELLEGLEGQWKIILFVDEADADPAVLRQVDEVLERFRDANPLIDARRIDPVAPASAGEFEAALSELVASREGEIAQAEAAVARAIQVYDGFRATAAGQSAGLRAAAQQLPQDSQVRRTLEQLAGFFAQVATDGDQFRHRVVEMTRTSGSRPLPDLEGARSALAQGFRVWGDQLASAATLFAQWRSQPSVPTAVRGVVASRIEPFEELASSMQASRQELEALPSVGLDMLARELLGGEAAVVVGGQRMSVIPAWRLFPRTVGAQGTDRISYSWGFRGEEVLSGAIRSIASARMPQVVFVHSEKDSLFRARQDNNDLVAVVDAVKSTGYSVTEWTPGRGERPTAATGQEQVFVVLPALRRTQLELSREERLLVAETEALLRDGRPVLLSVGRSMLAVLGQPDPWESILSGFGLEVDAGRVVLELVANADGQPEVRTWQLIERVAANSPIAGRLRGKAILFNQPMAIRLADPLPEGVRATSAVEIEPGRERWIADDWRGDGDGVREVPESKRLAEPLPVCVLAERKTPAGPQRAVVVASGGWLLSSLADLSDGLGGGRTALVNPGNRELLLASVAWLADRPDLLDGGLSGREVPRIESLGDGPRRAWMFGFGGFIVIGPVVAGAVVIAARRRRA
jgi:ABC-2 type transport system permease protein